MSSEGKSYMESPSSLKQQPITEVVIDGLAVLRIVKHCTDSLPSMVAGSLLGLDIGGTLEITYSYSFPVPKSGSGEGAVDDLDGAEYQIEMMKMLRDVNIDNNCVGWYQSMYMGTMCTNDVVGYQHSYQSSEELSDNSVVIMYDPIQSRRGQLVIKAFRLSARFMEMRAQRQNRFIPPHEILQELPLKIRNMGHVSAFLRCIQDTHKNELDCDFEPLAMTNNEAYSQKQLELLNTWMDDLISEQQRFQMYSKATAKIRQDHMRWLAKRKQENVELREMGDPLLHTRVADSGLRPLPDGPPRNDHLLILGQLERYCGQMNEHIDTSVHKVMLTAQMNSTS